MYAWNTLGSIMGVVLGGLLLLPWIGLKPMLMVGAGLDMGIGAAPPGAKRSEPASAGRLFLATSASAAGILLAVGFGVRLDQNRLVSGVYRNGLILDPRYRDVEFYRDGRTATVSVTRFETVGGDLPGHERKVDASLSQPGTSPAIR